MQSYTRKWKFANPTKSPAPRPCQPLAGQTEGAQNTTLMLRSGVSLQHWSAAYYYILSNGPSIFITSHFLHPVQIQTPVPSHWTVSRRKPSCCSMRIVVFTALLSSYCLSLLKKYALLPLKAQFLLIHFTLNLQWPQLWLCWFFPNACVSFQAHWLAHMGQTRITMNPLSNAGIC